MQLKLSCYCCGSTDFEYELIECSVDVEGSYYLYNEDIKDKQLTCSKCGLRDYIQNFVIVFK